MKKSLIALLAALLLVLLCAAAMADEAVNLTEQCSFKFASSPKKADLMTDGKYTTKWESNKVKNPYVAITAPEGQPIYGLYICLATMPQSYEIQVMEAGKWVKYCDGNTDYYHNYVAIPEGAKQVRLYVTQEKNFLLGINEIYCLGQGDLPSWVQLWEPTPTDVDILFVATHPDDEVLFFGGALPYYAIEQNRKIAVCYYSYSNTTRRSELLNGLWAIGIRQYPIVGTFSDHFDKTIDDAYVYAGGKQKVRYWICNVIRKTRPQVIVTQAEDGEYGHKQHQMVADSVKACFDLAADESYNPESVPTLGVWQAKKLYLHNYAKGESTISFDWSQPLEACGGLTGTQMAQKAYSYHLTQRSAGFILSDEGVTYKKKLYDNHTFGLYKSLIGADVRCDDFLEGIVTPSTVQSDFGGMLTLVTPTPAPTPKPAWMEVAPALNEKGYIDEGEFIHADDTNGLYIYINQTLRIVIERKFDASLPLTWFETEIWCDLEAGERLHTQYNDPAKRGKAPIDAAENAIKYQAVFAMNTDYYTYRISGPRRIGVEIRNGEVIYDDPYTKENNMFPNLSTLALYEDGSMSVDYSWDHTAKDFVEAGAVDVFSFGPMLIKDGKVNADLYSGNNLISKNPRAALGMVEPGHYVYIMCEGRLKRSGGVTMNQLALLMREKGCTQALNLDGGQTCVVVFMGKQLNQIGKYDGKTSARKTCEILCIGTSDQVGKVEFK